MNPNVRKANAIATTKANRQIPDHHIPDPRPSAGARGYGRRWGKVRLLYLQRNPLCRMCADRGYVVAATVVDHIKPVTGRNDPTFWIEAGWQSLCKLCHDSIKQQIDKFGGETKGCSANGWDARDVRASLNERQRVGSGVAYARSVRESKPRV